MNHDELVEAFEKLQDKFEKAQKAAGGKIVVYAQKKLPEFKGTPGENVDDWVVKAKEAVKLQNLKGKDAADFLTSHLAGDALIELKYATDQEKQDPEKLLELIQDTYGDSRPAIELLDRFNNRKQREKEPLADHAHALMKYLDRAYIKDPTKIPDKEIVLKNRFAENIKDQNLRRDVKKTNRDHPGCTFRQLRTEAFALADDCREARKTLHQELLKVKSDEEGGAFSFTQHAQPSQTSEMSSVKEQIKQLMELQKNQQEQMSLQQKIILDRQKQLTATNNNTGVNMEKDRTGKGPCHYCQKMGHLKKDCWKFKQQHQKRDQMAAAQIQSQFPVSLPYVYPQQHTVAHNLVTQNCVPAMQYYVPTQVNRTDISSQDSTNLDHTRP